jgi:hypothetical protein
MLAGGIEDPRPGLAEFVPSLYVSAFARYEGAGDRYLFSVYVNVNGGRMGREQQYENCLVEIVSHLKGLHTILSSVMLDTAALRQTVLVGRADLAEYSEHVKAGAEIAKPLLESALRSYDEVIARVRDSQKSDTEKATPANAETRVLH